MSKENSRERIIQVVFGMYPGAKAFHFTSDNQAFTEENDAKNHAATLEDKEVLLVKRSAVSNSQEVEGAEEGAGFVAITEVVNTDKGTVDAERAALVERYTELIGKKPAHNAGVAKLKEAIEKAEAELDAKEEPETKKGKTFIATQEFLDANPELGDDVKVGDEVEIPGE